MIVDSVGDEKTVRVFGRDVPQSMFVIRLFYFFYFASFGSLFPMLVSAKLVCRRNFNIHF